MFLSDTEFSKFDKLSQYIRLTPSLQFPIAQAEIQPNHFLDRLDFDYERDDYPTIYISDSTQRLIESSVKNVFDQIELSAEVACTYSCSPVELEGSTSNFNRTSMSKLAKIPEGTPKVISMFQDTKSLRIIDIRNDQLLLSSETLSIAKNTTGISYNAVDSLTLSKQITSPC